MVLRAFKKIGMSCNIYWCGFFDWKHPTKAVKMRKRERTIQTARLR